MISHATGQPIRSRMSRAELRENEIRVDVAQGPVPACLLKGYEPPPVVARTADRVPPDGPASSRKEP